MGGLFLACRNGLAVLVDGAAGFFDFDQNWLCARRMARDGI